MATLALFPSVLGVRPGIHTAVARLEAAGHQVRLIDLLGHVHDEYEPAMTAMRALGEEALMAQALERTADLPPGSATMGWSAGGSLAQAVAMANPAVTRTVLVAGAGDPAWFPGSWRSGLAAQAHSTVGDPWREEEALAALVAVTTGTGAPLAVFDYPGKGHLFDDESKADEYQPLEAALLWERVLAFLE